MINIIKNNILDFQNQTLDPGTSRHLKIETIKRKATVCIGARRSGKSTYLLQIIKRLLETGVSKENILGINFFDERLHNLKSQDLGIITDAYYSLYPDKKDRETIYIFFDEIQVIANWEYYIERILRTENCEIYITGSSANMLSKEIATQMRGRSLAWELFPFSFKEFLDHNGIEYNSPLTTHQKIILQNSFDKYWLTGGYPEVIHTSEVQRVKIHQGYYNAMIYRDLIERYQISNPQLVTDLAHKLIDNVSSLYSVNKLTDYLKAIGHKVSKQTVSQCIEWFEDAYFLFPVGIFDASVTKRKVNPHKIYCIDHSLIKSITANILINSGHLLENLVYIFLRRLQSEIYYYKTKNGREVDFLLPAAQSGKVILQVSETLLDPLTKKREVSALDLAMKELKQSKSIIVTRKEEETIKTDNGTISVIPAWKFLLMENEIYKFSDNS